VARYAEGDWFAVPLRSGGYAVGVIARLSNSRGANTALGYFFAPRIDPLPKLDQVERLKPADSILVRRFGDLGLHNGTWPIVGHSSQWRREDWPVPVFAVRLPGTNLARKDYYDADDPANLGVQSHGVMVLH
jgi:hypothetical protein